MSLRDASRRSSGERQPSHGGPSNSALQSAASLALDDARRKFETLSLRERSVLQRVAEGYSVVEIGRLLGNTPKTVDTCKARIERKLGLTHRTDYVRFALQLGLIGNASTQQGATTTGSRR
jgi:DNA-binding NarL/FixJ family response regulator